MMPFSHDHGMIDYFRGIGYTVIPATVVAGVMQRADTGAPVTPEAGTLNIVSNSFDYQARDNDGGVLTALRATTRPVLIMTYESSDSPEFGVFSSSGATTPAGSVWIQDASSPILPTGLTSGTSVALLNNPSLIGSQGSAKYITHGIGYNASATLGAYFSSSAPSAGDPVAYLSYEPGATLADGSIAPGRRVYLGIPQDGSTAYPPQIDVTDPTNYYTAIGREFLDKAIEVASPCSPTFDFGDYQLFAAANQVASSDLRIGATPTDADAANPTTGDGTADDTTSTDDET